MTRKPVESQLLTSDSGNTCEIFPLPTDEAFLKELLTYIFETYWREIVFGPMIQGGAFEFQCPNAPTKIKLFDGYLTVNFGNPGTHFHICIGENKGSPKKPTPGELQRHRKTSQAEFFRNLDGSGAPVAWGGLFQRQGRAADVNLLSQVLYNGRATNRREARLVPPGHVEGPVMALSLPGARSQGPEWHEVLSRLNGGQRVKSALRKPVRFRTLMISP
jgi:hypothetical protein